MTRNHVENIFFSTFLAISYKAINSSAILLYYCLYTGRVINVTHLQAHVYTLVIGCACTISACSGPNINIDKFSMIEYFHLNNS